MSRLLAVILIDDESSSVDEPARSPHRFDLRPLDVQLDQWRVSQSRHLVLGKAIHGDALHLLGLVIVGRMPIRLQRHAVVLLSKQAHPSTGFI